ncbi:MAG: glycosyltransferase [Alphaproteobacteria bacterium]
MDGLAAGRPVISNVPGDAARLLTEGDAGMAVAPDDAAGLAGALVSLVEDPARRAAMGAAARSLAVRQHDRRLLAARFTALVEAMPIAQTALGKPDISPYREGADHAARAPSCCRRKAQFAETRRALACAGRGAGILQTRAGPYRPA